MGGGLITGDHLAIKNGLVDVHLAGNLPAGILTNLAARN
jgi:hypothetical protein